MQINDCILAVLTQVPLSLIWHGAPYSGAIYTNPSKGFSTDPSGNIVENAANDPMYEYVDGKKLFRWFDGTNLIDYSTRSDEWDIGGGATYNPISEEFTLPSGGFVRPIESFSAEYQNNMYTALSEIEVISGVSGELRIFDGVDGTSENFTDSCECTVTRTMDATSTRLTIIIRGTNAIPLVVKIPWVQVNEGGYPLPRIPTTGTPVTVSPATLSLQASGDGAEEPFSDVTDDGERFNFPLGQLLNGRATGVQETMPLSDGTIFGGVSVIDENMFTTTSNGGTGFEVLEIGKRYLLVSSGDTTSTEFSIYNDFGDIFNRLGDFGVFNFVAVHSGLYFRNAGAGVTNVTWSIRQVSPAVGTAKWENFKTAQVLAPVLPIDLSIVSGTPTITDNVVDFLNEASTVSETAGWDTETTYKIKSVVTGYTGTGDIELLNDGADKTDAYGNSMIVAANGTYTHIYAPGTDLKQMTSKVGHTATVTVFVKEVQTLLNSNTDVPYFYIDPDTAFLTAIDDEQNTCTSDVAITKDVQHDFHLAWLTDKFWITLNESKGNVEDFSGSFSEVGEFVKGTNSGVYHTSRNEAVFDDVPEFDYVYHEGVQVFHNGEPVIVYK